LVSSSLYSGVATLFDHAFPAAEREEGASMIKGKMVRRMLAVFVIAGMVLAGSASGQSLTVQVAKKEGIGALLTDAKA
jgi:hypothetical protein